MNIIVQKYGGSSLAEDSKLRAVAQRIAETRRSGAGLVVVVSAMGDTTSRLLAHAGRLNATPEHRELDMLLAAGEQKSASLLSLALHDLDIEAVALTGAQAGVCTCEAHLNARIRKVDPTRMHREVAAGRVVVVAGFQGASPAGDITTLGRGGSDTTAVAIAAAVGASRCEIYSDVDGVYTADPRVVPEATRLRMLSLTEMKVLAHHGSGVLNERAIDYALEHGVTIHARRAHGDGGQTIVRTEQGTGGRTRIAGIATHAALLRIDFTELADRAALGELLDEYDSFAPELALGGRGLYLLPTDQLADVPGLCEVIKARCGEGVQVHGTVASVSAVGRQAGRDPGTLAFAQQLLSAQQITVHHAFATEHAVTCLVPEEAQAKAAQVFHAGFRIADTGVADVA
ncbi:MAG: aspartate kinase [Gammaproteobacteria bacterium]|nr:aspartate kinase [Gammaproteobacteria bacterium]TVQ49525.1 MAG: aspartate kinase [Gammaproteobacteria bacterium]